eukprot:612801-Rhodomonas_salina.1
MPEPALALPRSAAASRSQRDESWAWCTRLRAPSGLRPADVETGSETPNWSKEDQSRSQRTASRPEPCLASSAFRRCDDAMPFSTQPQAETE